MSTIPCPHPRECGVQSHVVGSTAATVCAHKSGTRVNGVVPPLPVPASDNFDGQRSYDSPDVPSRPGLEALVPHGYSIDVWQDDPIEGEVDFSEYPEAVYATKPLGDTGWSVTAFGGEGGSDGDPDRNTGYAVIDGAGKYVALHTSAGRLPGTEKGLPEGAVQAGYGTGGRGYVANEGDPDALRQWVEVEGLKRAEASQRGARP